MSRTPIEGRVYDHPAYYDLVFGADWRREFDFLQAAFARHAARPLERIFEPACGTGRLLFRFADAGFAVAGNDLNLRAVDYCNRRLVRRGHAPSAVVGDMCDFRLERPVDLAFCLINTFRHLLSEREAAGFLKCAAAALAPGGLFLLGLHLTPTVGPGGDDAEEWSARRGTLSVHSRLQSTGVDLVRRREGIAIRFQVVTPTESFDLVDSWKFRTYTAPQILRYARSEPSLELCAAYDFRYDLDAPLEIDDATEDVVVVLRKR